MPSTKMIVIVAVLLISLASCAEDENKLVKRDITAEIEYAPKDVDQQELDVAGESIVVAKDGLHRDGHRRVKRNWPFKSSQQNADIINSYYQSRPGDHWLVSNIQKPFARYVGRALGDNFPAVRDSIIDYQNKGYSFGDAHSFSRGYHPKNWFSSRDTTHLERSNPYNGHNQYDSGSPYLHQNWGNTYQFLRRNGK